ncbi:MAG: hypothetical protein M3Z41_02625 [Candidatus Eremiobacteraeota bacterium]|nr:hypothetical protein [Candidatus Eremiobacteraeota bacterium]
MNAYLVSFLAMLAVAFMLLAAAAISVFLRARALQRRVQTLKEHPTLGALRKAQTLADRLHDLPATVAAIRARSTHIAEAVAELLATSAVLDLEVDRVSFATKLLLQTFVPTLRGSMAD